jgi:hypothetical protein
MRLAQAEVLKNLGEKYKTNTGIDASKLFKISGKLIIKLCEVALKQETETCSELVTKIACVKDEAYDLACKIVIEGSRTKFRST